MSPSSPAAPSPAETANALSAWFATAKRDLPWRKNRTGYRVWLSEIMLQQTQVAVVERYFAAFTTRFPTVEDLANASEDEVLSMWAGLGYYARGRNLHRAAKAVATDFAGEFPQTAVELRTLPGVGPYTAGAIASLAFGATEAIVDGNVFRVLARLFDDDTPIDTSAGKAVAWERAKELVSTAKSPAILNESMMELGALVCTPRSPKCEVCPLQSSCLGFAADTATTLPVKAKKTARRAVRLSTLVLTRDDGCVWLEKQPATGLFGGLYAPPSVELKGRTQPRTVAKKMAKERGVALDPSTTPVEVARTLTHRDLTFVVFTQPVDAPAGTGRWVDRAQLSQLGLSAAARAILDRAWPEP